MLDDDMGLLIVLYDPVGKLESGVVPEISFRPRNFPLGLGKGLALFLHQQAREIVAIGRDGIGKLDELGLALREGRLGPAGIGCLGGFDGFVGLSR